MTRDEVVAEALAAADLPAVVAIVKCSGLAVSAAWFDELEGRMLGADGDHRLSLLRLLVAVGILGRDPGLTARARLHWATHCRHEGRSKQALRHADHAYAAADAAGDDIGRARARGIQAVVHEERGDVRAAATSYEAAVRLSGDDMAALFLRHGLAGCLRTLGRPAEALAVVVPAVVQAAERGLYREAARSLLLQGLLHQDMGVLAAAHDAFVAARQQAEAAGDSVVAFQAMNDGAALLLETDPAAAVTAFEAILEIVEGWGDPAVVASAHNNLGTANMFCRRHAEAIEQFRLVLAAKRSSGDRQGEAIACMGLGDAHLALGDGPAAASFYRMSLDVVLETGDLGLLTMYASRVDKVDHDDEARSFIRSARDLAREAGRLDLVRLLDNLLADRSPVDRRRPN